MEFLVRIELRPTGLAASEERELVERELQTGHGYLQDGSLRRIWRLPGRRASLSHWAVKDATELHGLIAAFPFFPYMEVEVTALADHPLESEAPSTPA